MKELTLNIAIKETRYKWSEKKMKEDILKALDNHKWETIHTLHCNPDEIIVYSCEVPPIKAKWRKSSQ